LGVIDEIVEGALTNFKHNFARRVKQVGLIIYGWGAPEEVGEYLDNAHLCYAHGMFIATMLMAATAVETALRIKYTNVTGKKKVRRKKGEGEFEYLIEWAAENSIITPDQAANANNMRKSVRNKLIHIKAFNQNELKRIDELRGRKTKDLTDAEREMLALYSLRTDPSGRLAKRIIEISDEIIEQMFPSIGRIPFELKQPDTSYFFTDYLIC